MGLILPAATHIMPWLTPLAAGGLVLTMLGALVVHFRRNEIPKAIAPIVLLVLAAIIVYGRAVAFPL